MISTDPFSTDNVTFKVESISTTSETTFVTGPSDTFTQSTMNQSSISLTTSLLLKDLSSNTTHENASKTTELSSVSHNYGTTESSLQSPKEINETNDATEKETPFEVPIDTAESHVDGSDSNGNGQAAEEFAIDIPPDDNNEEEFHPEQNGPSHDFEENPDDVPNEDENGDGQVIVGFPAMEESEMEENSNGGGEEIQSESNGVTEENFAQGADY